MKKNEIFIDAGEIDTSRPKDKPAKTNQKLELVKKVISVLQHFSSKSVAKIIWHFFTLPGKAKFNELQRALIDSAKQSKQSYNGYDIVSYKWGNNGPKVLLAHGWRSKIADFRKMIEVLVAEGYVVEGIDMKAHGQSSGEHTALPEFRDIIKKYYVKNAPYHAVIGYSMGGIATGIVLSEISKELQPEKLFLIAAPSYVRYFFKSAVEESGCNEAVYNRLCDMVEERYGENIDYFDLRGKVEELSQTEIHLIYDECDKMVPFKYGIELKELLKDSYFVHTRGIGHYKIIVYPEVLSYLIKNLKSEESVLA